MDETTTRAQRGYITTSLLTTSWTDSDGRQHEVETFNAHESAKLRKRLARAGLTVHRGARVAGYRPAPAEGALAALKRVAAAVR